MIFVAPTSRRAVSLGRELNATRVKFSVINSLQDCEHEMVVQIQIRGRDAPVGIFTEVPSKIEIIPWVLYALSGHLQKINKKLTLFSKINVSSTFHW